MWGLNRYIINFNLPLFLIASVSFINDINNSDGIEMRMITMIIKIIIKLLFVLPLTIIIIISSSSRNIFLFF